MQNDDQNPEFALEQQSEETVEDTNEDVTSPDLIIDEIPEGNDSIEDELAQFKKVFKSPSEAAKIRRLWTKNQNQPQTVKQTVTKTAQINNSKPDSLSRDEVEEILLKSQGMDEKELEALRRIAKGANISLLDAKKDEVFLAYQDKRREEEKKAKANLGASRGSGRVQQKADTKTPNLSREEHMALAKEKIGS